jgi:hypothetical protein
MRHPAPGVPNCLFRGDSAHLVSKALPGGFASVGPGPDEGEAPGEESHHGCELVSECGP